MEAIGIIAIAQLSAAGGTAPYTGPLDIVAGAVVAYGQRALSAAQRSSALYTIRRDSDDATQVFSSDAITGDAPLESIASFLGTPKYCAFAEIVSGGSGYSDGQFIATLVGGVYDTQASVSVIAADGSVVSVDVINNPGSYTTPPTGIITTSGGDGTGLTLRCIFRGVGFYTNFNDQSGNAANVLTVIEDFEPSWAMFYNNIPCLALLDGQATGILQGNDGSLTWDGGPGTLFVVVNVSSSGNNASTTFSVDQTPSNNNFFDLSALGTNITPYTEMQSGMTFSEWDVDVPSAIGTGLSVLELIYDADGNVSLYRNGVSVSMSGGSVVPLPAITGRFRLQLGSGVFYAVFEVVLWNSELSSGNRALIRQNMADYYGIALS